MANPMNEAFSTLLSAIKKNPTEATGGLKIRKRPDYQAKLKEINSHNWQRHEQTGDLLLDTPDKKRVYQEMLMLSGSTSASRNIFREDVDFLKQGGSLGNVVVDGTPSRVKANRSFSKLTNPNQIKFNNRAKYDLSLKAGAETRDYRLKEGGKNSKEVIKAMKEYGIYTPEAYTEFQQWNIRSVEDYIATIPKGYTAGHAKSAAKGGPMTARNLWKEASGENYSRQHKQDASDELLDAIGADRTWKIAVGKYFGLIEKTEAEKLFTEDDMIEALATGNWQSVLEKRRAAQT
tara:strand:+ start:718 stop:1590 length:873 start_codon:yes stop_codon:yes gene_type:complete